VSLPQSAYDDPIIDRHPQQSKRRPWGGATVSEAEVMQ
jgi:hypothetical protein